MGESFHNVYMYQLTTMYTLSYNFICQLHCNKAEILKTCFFEYTIIPFCLCSCLECTLCCIPHFCLCAICKFILFLFFDWFSFFFFLTVLCGLQDLSLPTRIKSGPWQWKHQVLTTGPPFFKILFSFFLN